MFSLFGIWVASDWAPGIMFRMIENETYDEFHVLQLCSRTYIYVNRQIQA